MLSKTYKKVKPSIVSFVQNFEIIEGNEKPSPYPFIIGTGFIVHPDGIVATNRHVAESITKISTITDDNTQGVSCKLSIEFPDKGIMDINFEIAGIHHVYVDNPGHYYGDPRGPDLAFIQINGYDLPSLEYDTTFIPLEGINVATAGYPMGRDALMAPGWVHQLTPTLNSGIISAVQPLPCTTPHGFSINTLIQGGASGSPVFLPETGKVIGTLYASLNDTTIQENGMLQAIPAGHSLIVPAHYSVNFMEKLLASGIPFLESKKSIADAIGRWDGKDINNTEGGRWEITDVTKPSISDS